jgi:hypothetical protein
MNQPVELYTIDLQPMGGEILHVLGAPDRLIDLRRLAVRAAGTTQLLRDLKNEGFTVVEPQSLVFNPSEPAWAGCMVRFPDTAPHVYAGQALRVVVAEDGLPALLDPQTQEMLMADDRPWRRGEAHPMKGGQLVDPDIPFEQVPLGALVVPEGQFKTPEDEAIFLSDMSTAGYIIAA